MAKYVVLLTLLRSPEELTACWNCAAARFATAMYRGTGHARCLNTWIPVDLATHGRWFGLWEAEEPAQVQAALVAAGLQDCFAIEIIQVEEAGWFPAGS